MVSEETTMAANTERQVTLRHDLRPGDLGRVTEFHGVLYAGEYGFNYRFEAYVAETLAEFAHLQRQDHDRLWLAEREGRLVGSVAILGREGGAAQLRWLLAHPDARGAGLGRRLVDEALAFSRAAGYTSVFLWTVDLLTPAARLYTAADFHKTEEKPPAPLWGPPVKEQRYDLDLTR
jgi:GNAT superfamily N-acetyltransferase